MLMFCIKASTFTSPENGGDKDHVNSDIDLVVVVRAIGNELLLQVKDIRKRHCDKVTCRRVLLILVKTL